MTSSASWWLTATLLVLALVTDIAEDMLQRRWARQRRERGRD